MGQDKTQLISDHLDFSSHAYLLLSLLANNLQKRKRSLHFHHRIFIVLLLSFLLASYYLRHLDIRQSICDHASALLFASSNLLHSGSERNHYVCILEANPLYRLYLSLFARKDTYKHGFWHSLDRILQSKCHTI